MTHDPAIKRLAGELDARRKRIVNGKLVALLSVSEQVVICSAVVELRGDHAEIERLMREVPGNVAAFKNERGR